MKRKYLNYFTSPHPFAFMEVTFHTNFYMLTVKGSESRIDDEHIG